MQDFLKKNLKLLSQKSPYLYSLIEKVRNDEKYCISKSKSGNATLLGVFPDGARKALHSKYDPINEAEQLIEAVYSKEKANYILIGLGLGYHLNSLYKKISSYERIIIFEKNTFLFQLALTHNDFSQILKNPQVSWHIDINPNQIEQIFFDDRANIALNGFTPVIHKPLIELEQVYYNLIQDEIEQAYQKFKIDIDTKAAFSQKYYTNIFANTGAILESPGIVSLKNIFSNIPVVVVSAGPSLDKNIGLLRSARNRIIVLAVATALKPLLRNGIEPDIVIAIDPNEETIQSFNAEKIPERLWLVFGPCIPPEIGKYFKSQKITLENRTALAMWITDHSEKKGGLENTSSVANSAFHLAIQMGCEPIILVGQDLSFEGHRMHCTDSFYDQSNKDNISADKTLGILDYSKYRAYMPSMTSSEDIFLNKTITTKAMNTYKYQLKKGIREKNIILNATEGGVNIPGAINISLKEALNKHCQENKGFIAKERLSKINKPKINGNLLISISKQLKKLNRIDKKINKIIGQYLLKNMTSKKKQNFVKKMEHFYAELIKDEDTTSLIQGYDYMGFIEWNQKTKKINNLISKLSSDDRLQKKITRDIIFINRLKKNLDFLTKGFKSIEKHIF